MRMPISTAMIHSNTCILLRWRMRSMHFFDGTNSRDLRISSSLAPVLIHRMPGSARVRPFRSAPGPGTPSTISSAPPDVTTVSQEICLECDLQSPTPVRPFKPFIFTRQPFATTIQRTLCRPVSTCMCILVLSWNLNRPWRGLKPSRL